MQQYKQPTANQQMVQPLAPKKKATNRNVTAISSLPKSNHANAGSVEKAPAPGSNVAPDYKPGFGMPTTPVPGNGNISDTPGYDLPNPRPNLPTPGNPVPPQTGGNTPVHNGGSNGQSQGLMWQYQPIDYQQVSGNAARPEYNAPQNNYKPTDYQQVGGSAARPEYNAPQNNYKPTDYQQVGGNAARPEYNAPKGNYTPAEYESVTGNAPQFESNTPQTEFNGREYQSNGYTGVQGKSDYNYDPRSESMVQNQITGLLDPNSELMRKAIAQAQGYSASRGLQSSSIGSETALSSMIDKALPIAQQDASTNANADQAGWQNSFAADQNNLGREHDASMFDKQGELNTNLQNDQLSFQNTQNNANREQQTELQQLQYKQSLGLLDAQGEQRLQELNAQQGFQSAENQLNREQQGELQQLQYLQSLGMLDAQGEQRMQELNSQQGFQSNENQLNREQQAELQQLQYLQSLGMLDAQGEQRMQELNSQQGFQSNENQLNREQQAELQQLQYLQSLGMLDAQGEQRMQELNAQQGFQDHMQDKQHGQNVDMLERQEQVQKRRDELMSQLEMGKIDKLYLQDLEKTKLTWEHDDSVFERNLNGQFQLEYRQSSAEAYNRYLEQVANVYSNPNMTKEQQTAGVEHLRIMFEAQRQQMKIIYGYSSGNSDESAESETGISDPNNPPIENNNNNSGGNQYIGGNVGGGAPGGGVRDRQLMR